MMNRPRTQIKWVTAGGVVHNFPYALQTSHLKNILEMMEAGQLSKCWMRLPTYSELKKLAKQRGLQPVKKRVAVGRLEAAEAMAETLHEAAFKPYPDSDLKSLLATLRIRAKGALETWRKAAGK